MLSVEQLSNNSHICSCSSNKMGGANLVSVLVKQFTLVIVTAFHPITLALFIPVTVDILCCVAAVPSSWFGVVRFVVHLHLLFAHLSCLQDIGLHSDLYCDIYDK